MPPRKHHPDQLSFDQYYSWRTSFSNRTLMIWRCGNCGQMHFTSSEEAPPDICEYCQDMTTWRRFEDFVD